MPEMADVEVLKRRFNAELKGKKITAVKILNRALVKGEPGLDKKLTGKKIVEAERYGKYLFVNVGDGFLILHFGLTGHLLFETGKQKPSSEAMLIISVDGVDLIYEAARLFGMAGWCEDQQAFIKEKKLGPDAASLSQPDFLSILHGVKGAIKPALMDQHKLAGIGNVYADEILFRAGIHPQMPVKGLTLERLRKVHEQVQRVHEDAVKVGAVRTKMPEGSLMKIRKTSKVCPKCGGPLELILVGGRETLFCPHCQHL